MELLDQTKSNKLIQKILESNVSDNEKKFLIEASKRHNVFSYSLIADYYSHAPKEMQELMEESVLVIVDFKDAIKNGYIDFTKEIEELYGREH